MRELLERPLFRIKFYEFGFDVKHAIIIAIVVLLLLMMGFIFGYYCRYRRTEYERKKNAFNRLCKWWKSCCANSRWIIVKRRLEK